LHKELNKHLTLSNKHIAWVTLIYDST